MDDGNAVLLLSFASRTHCTSSISKWHLFLSLIFIFNFSFPFPICIHFASLFLNYTAIEMCSHHFPIKCLTCYRLCRTPLQFDWYTNDCACSRCCWMSTVRCLFQYCHSVYLFAELHVIKNYEWYEYIESNWKRSKRKELENWESSQAQANGAVVAVLVLKGATSSRLPNTELAILWYCRCNKVVYYLSLNVNNSRRIAIRNGCTSHSLIVISEPKTEANARNQTLRLQFIYK